MPTATHCQGWVNPSSTFYGPIIISLSSYYSPAGSTSLVTITGENFYSYSTVLFGTFNPSVYFISSNSLQFYVPSSLLPGIYPLQVFNGAVGSNIVSYSLDNSSGYWIINPDGSITNTNTGGINITGTTTTNNLVVNNNIILDGTYGTNYLQFPDGTKQYTSYKSKTATHYAVVTNDSISPFGSTLATIPYINFADVGTYASTYGMNYWDFVVFDYCISWEQNFSNTTGTLYNRQINGQLYVYPTAFITTFGVTGTPFFFLTGGCGNPLNGSSAYSPCPVTPYTTNGRPIWSNNFIDPAIINNDLPVHTYNDGSTAKLILEFLPLLFLPPYNQFIYNISFSLKNSGKIPPSKITTVNFNIENII